jgi:hypothetical protein
MIVLVLVLVFVLVFSSRGKSSRDIRIRSSIRELGISRMSLISLTSIENIVRGSFLLSLALSSLRGFIEPSIDSEADRDDLFGARNLVLPPPRPLLSRSLVPPLPRVEV